MANQYSDLFLMHHLASISQQKIYPTIPIKIEMPLWKTLHVTRLWNHAREQEIYLSQQQQKNDWWIHQMADNNPSSLQSLENYLPPSWLEDTTSTTVTSTIGATVAPELSACQLGPLQYDTTTNDGIDLVHDDDDDDDEEEDADTILTTTQTDTVADQTRNSTEKLLTQDELPSLLGVSTQDRKRKHEDDPATTQSNPTPPPATRTSTPPSSAMVKV